MVFFFIFIINSIFVEQLTLNLALGIKLVRITLVAMIARAISSLANIRFAYAVGPGATFCAADRVTPK